MEQNIAKRMVTAGGGTRITIIRDEHPDNPRYNTDEPLHCEDWSRNFSIMTRKERESQSKSARKLLEYLLNNYADCRKVIDCLVSAGKDNKDNLDDKLVYDRSAKAWVLQTCGSHYDYETRKNVEGWYEADRFDEKKYYIDVCSLLDEVCDSTIDHLAGKLLNDKVKMMEYSFGYYGDISFSDGASCDSEGIAWFEKKEFLKYSGNSEQWWNERTCMEIDWLHEELEAWADNEVYGFRIEELDRVKVHETHQDGSVKDYEREDWHETESCWGFYGELGKSLEWMLDAAGLKMDDLKETA